MHNEPYFNMMWMFLCQWLERDHIHVWWFCIFFVILHLLKLISILWCSEHKITTLFLHNHNYILLIHDSEFLIIDVRVMKCDALSVVKKMLWVKAQKSWVILDFHLSWIAIKWNTWLWACNHQKQLQSSLNKRISFGRMHWFSFMQRNIHESKANISKMESM